MKNKLCAHGSPNFVREVRNTEKYKNNGWLCLLLCGSWPRPILIHHFIGRILEISILRLRCSLALLRLQKKKSTSWVPLPPSVIWFYAAWALAFLKALQVILKCTSLSTAVLNQPLPPKYGTRATEFSLQALKQMPCYDLSTSQLPLPPTYILHNSPTMF